MRRVGRCGRKRLKNCRGMKKGCSMANDESFIELKKWMKEKVDGRHRTITQLQPYKFSGTGRGMQALKGFNVGDCVVSIPFNLLITTDTVLKGIGSELNRYCCTFSPQQLLTLFLCLEKLKGPRSEWFAYINTLPSFYSTPLYFSVSEIHMLNDGAHEEAEILRKRFSNACEEIKKFVIWAFPSLRSSLSDTVLKWAWSTVDTRSVFLEDKPHALLSLKPEESNVALAPFLDMLNHTDTTQVTAALNLKSMNYEIITHKRYRKYDQVFISYGPHDNAKLLVNYGFTIPHNVNNSYRFTCENILRCFPEVDHCQRKIYLLQDCDLYKNLVCTVEGPSWSLMTALKLLALTWDQLSMWKKLLQGIPISNENEMVAIKMATHLVQSTLKEAIRHRKAFKNQVPSTHLQLIESLAIDDVEILESSLRILKS